MFTGLVQTTATLVSLQTRGAGASTLRVRLAEPLEKPAIGESVAVNGVCLTLVRAADAATLDFDILDETLRRTALGRKAVGARLNIERALRAGDAIGGHLVSGHVDGTATLLGVREGGPDAVFRLRADAPWRDAILPCLLPKGSVAVDGTSLTLVDIAPADATFSVHLIPHTLAATALSTLTPGDAVNIEADLLAKAARNAAPAAAAPAPPPVTWNRLRRAGFLG